MPEVRTSAPGSTGLAGQPEPEASKAITLLHLTDLHFGVRAVPEQIDAIEELITERRCDVVVISGDVSQRARIGEFLCARALIRDAAKVSRVLVIPGNHDVAWWRSPLHLLGTDVLYAKYRRYVCDDLEPVLRIPGATLVGLNSAKGVSLRTLTWNPRDTTIIGDVGASQLTRLRARVDAAPPGDARIVVTHHNLLRGEISHRNGLAHPRPVLRALGEMGVDLVLCGHDHQEAVRRVDGPRSGLIISAGGTVSTRTREGRPATIGLVTIASKSIEISTLVWSAARRAFGTGPVECFDRSSHASA